MEPVRKKIGSRHSIAHQKLHSISKVENDGIISRGRVQRQIFWGVRARWAEKREDSK